MNVKIMTNNYREFKVGMPYEDEPGYYEREDYDQQLSGIAISQCLLIEFSLFFIG
jgi:hypothetical protein